MITTGNMNSKPYYVSDESIVYKIKKGYLVDETGVMKIYSSGGIVTYQVDTDVSYTEEVDEGTDTLHPTSFTPSKSGYTFLGWREDTTATDEVLSEKTLDDVETLTLYAVFRRECTLTLYNASSSAAKATYYGYYNNNNIRNPTVTLTQTAVSGWSPIGWATAASGSSIAVSNGGNVTLTGNATYYGVYSKTVTVSYAANGGSGTTAASTGTAYYHSYAGVTNASISLRACGFTRTSPYYYNFSKWALNSASGTQYAAGATISLNANATMYAVWVMRGQIVSVATIASYLGGENKGSYVEFKNGNSGGDEVRVSWKKSGWPNTGGYTNFRVYWYSSTYGSTCYMRSASNAGDKTIYGTRQQWAYATMAISGNPTITLLVDLGQAYVRISEIYLY